VTQGGEGEGRVSPGAITGDNREESRAARTAAPPEAHVSDGQGGESGAGESAAASPTTPAPEQWTGPSQQEWEQVVQGLSAISEIFSTPPEEEGGLSEEDVASMDIGQLLDYAVDSRIAPLLPYIENSAASAGQQVEAQAFDSLKGQLGDFDQDLAHHIAEGIYQSGASPEDALYQGAQYAAEVRKNERQAGVDDYQSKLRRPLNQEPGVAGAGSAVKGRPKTYDEVIEAWAAQSEV
jgi:hypothetical protein